MLVVPINARRERRDAWPRSRDYFDELTNGALAIDTACLVLRFPGEGVYMSTEKTTHPPKREKVPIHVENSTDATRGEPLALRAQKRKAELEAALAELPATETRARNDIEIALGAVAEMLTGDTDHLAAVTAADLSRWLESSKHLGERAPTRRSAR